MLGFCIVGFLSGLIFCTPMGYDFAIVVFDKGLNSWNLFIFAFLEVILVGWVYGFDQFIKNLDDMELPIRGYMAIYLKIALKYTSPFVLTVLLVAEWIQCGMNIDHHGETIPSVIKHLLTFASVIFLPIFVGWEIFKIFHQKNEQNRSSFKILLEPTKDWYKNQRITL